MIIFYYSLIKPFFRLPVILPVAIISLILANAVYAETSGEIENRGKALGKTDLPPVQTVTTEINPPALAIQPNKIPEDTEVPAGKSEEKTPARDAAKPIGKSLDKPVNERIAMESDKAVLNRADRIIELEGNVKVTQGETVITSHMIKIFLKEGANLEPSKKTGENAIEKVVASGNVVFKLGIGIAHSDHAVYSTSTKQLVLTGKEPKFISGDNTITGSKITVNRESGMVTIEGGGRTRVEAIIYSKEQL